jgi:photosystem II stability/assembly factor-like uncharacterized protein
MNKFLILFLSSLSILTNAQSDPNIKWLHASPQGQDLRWMKMWDANNWYLGGQGGMFMKTTDAGQTWTMNNRAVGPIDLSRYSHKLEATMRFDQNNGIICARNGAGILRTTDAGETFDTLRILSSGQGNIRGIYFVNSNLGFISGSDIYKLYKTTDGGLTWTQVPNLPDLGSGNAYYDVFATDELNIITCGTISGAGEQAKVYKTTDGGANWNTILLPTNQTIHDLEFVDANNGYLCGGLGFFKSTTDGGTTWSGGVSTPLGATNYKIKAANNEIYVAGNTTNLFKSTDNGSSWITLNMNPSGSNSSLNYCMDVVGSNIVVAGIRGNIYKSTNSGTDWNLLTQRVTESNFLRSFYVENTSGKIIVAGYQTFTPGGIIISNDGGNTWTASPQIIPEYKNLEKMQMFDNNNGFFSGREGYFAKTTDGAMSLTEIVIPFVGSNSS